jgi:hypothetical protein
LRVDYVDGFRGLTLLIMVFIQIYDSLAYSSIYTDPPFFIEAIHTVTPLPPSILFSFVTGMSVYLMIKNKLKKDTKANVIRKVLWTYGKYLLISIPFTTFMWGFSTYLEWNEAIQGIGLSAMITALIILCWKPKDYELLLSIPLLTITRHFLLLIQPLGELFPYHPPLNNISLMLGSVFVNALYRGWFSVYNLLPLMFAGVLFYKATRKMRVNKLLLISSIILIASLVINFTVMPIDYYGKNMSLTLYGIGACMVTFSLILMAYNKKKGFTKALTIAGLSSLFLYLSHNLLLLKWVYLFANNSLPEWLALTLSFPLTYAFYWLAKNRLKKKELLN